MNTAESWHRNKDGAQPPRLSFGAPSRRTELAAPAAGAVPISESGVVKSPLLFSPSLLRRILFGPIKFFWGMLFCQSVLGALAVLGWTCRLMQRAALKQWWRLSESLDKAGSFAEFVAGDPRTVEHLHRPNWFLAQNFRQTVRCAWATSVGNDPSAVGPENSLSPAAGEGRSTPIASARFPSPEGPSTPSGLGRRQGITARRFHVGRLFGGAFRTLKALFVSLWLNVRLGVQAIFNTWVLTLPACVLMLFGWYDGWNNSFNKGYEQFWVGPAVSWLGLMGFIAAMLYLPMAQARQAVSGSWRTFYQFRLVWTLVRRRWLACFGLATLYALCSVPMMILASVAMFLPSINPKLAELTPAQTIEFLNRYYFWSALYVFPAFVGLRLIAARIYGTAVLKAVQTGALGEDVLAENERHALRRLALLRIEPPRIRHPVLRLAAWAATRAGRITFGFLTGLAWFIFVAQPYITQFFNYRGAPVWLNQPLVQLPWFHHLPATLKNPWGDFLAAVIVVVVAWRLKRLVIWWKSIRRG